MDGRILDIQVLNASNISVPSFRFPGGIYLSINDIDSDLWKTSIKNLLRNSTVVWDETVKLTYIPRTLKMKLRASLEFGERLGNGELIGETQVKTSTLKRLCDSDSFVIVDVCFPAVGHFEPILKLKIFFGSDANIDSALLMPPTPSHNLVIESECTIGQDTDQGHAHLGKYMTGHGSSYLKEALECYKRVVDKCTDDHEQNHWARAAALTNFGWALLVSFHSDNSNAVDVETTIMCFREALKLRPLGHPDHVISTYHLAHALSQLHGCNSPPDNLYESALLFCTLLPLCPEGTFFHSVLLDKHGLDDVIEKCNGVPICGSEEDILFRRRVAMLCRVGHENRPVSFELLARALCLRGMLSDIDEGIEIRRTVLLFWPIGHREQAMPLNRLISALNHRFGLLRQACDLDEVIKLCRASLKVCPVDSNKDDLAVLLNNLGIVLARRFIASGDIDDINHAIGVIREAWTISPSRKRRLRYMYALLTRHFEEDLVAAIELFRELVVLNLDLGSNASSEREAVMVTVHSAFCAGFVKSMKDGPECMHMKVENEDENEDEDEEERGKRKREGAVGLANEAFGKWIQRAYTSKLE